MGALAARCLSLVALVLTGLAATAAAMAPTPGWPRPDLLLCVVALWALRRPGWTPALAVFALGLARDLSGGGPVGAGALGLLLAAELLRAQAPALRRRVFPLEWAAVVAAAAIAVAAPWLLLTLTLAPTPPLPALGARVAATALAYPLVALALRWAVRIGPAAQSTDGGLMFERRIAP